MLSDSQSASRRGELISQAPDETLALGARLGAAAFPGCVVCLYGELGAGKTLLTRGLARGLGLADDRAVTSPTFTLINEYDARLPLYHVDAYRLHSAHELSDLGIDEYFFGRGVTVIEWADRVAEILPADRLDVRLEHLGLPARRLTWTAHGPRHAALARAFTH